MGGFQEPGWRLRTSLGERKVSPVLLRSPHRGRCLLFVLDGGKRNRVLKEYPSWNSIRATYHVMSPVLYFPLIHHHFPRSMQRETYEDGTVMPCPLAPALLPELYSSHHFRLSFPLSLPQLLFKCHSWYLALFSMWFWLPSQVCAPFASWPLLPTWMSPLRGWHAADIVRAFSSTQMVRAGFTALCTRIFYSDPNVKVNSIPTTSLHCQVIRFQGQWYFKCYWKLQVSISYIQYPVCLI